MQDDVLGLARDLVAIPSETTGSNAQICDFLQRWLEARDFSVERIGYRDAAQGEKVNLIARRGRGTGGLGFFSHSDTVPGDPREWEPFDPALRDGKLFGRGTCDMKGPLAATLLAAAGADSGRLRKPVTVVVTSDEEQGHRGAHHILEHSEMLARGWPEYVVVAEPTGLKPVYAHKGAATITVTAHGKAAHTSTEKGISANFIIAPFLADLAALVPVFRTSDRFRNPLFDPPTNGFNITISDGNCRPNVTAAKTVVQISLRLMPDDHREEQFALIRETAGKYDLQVEQRIVDSFYIRPDAEVIRAACTATGCGEAETVPYGTEAEAYQRFAQAVILGPGDIAQAHTVGEWIEVAQMQDAVGVYERMIGMLCC